MENVNVLSKLFIYSDFNETLKKNINSTSALRRMATKRKDKPINGGQGAQMM